MVDVQQIEHTLKQYFTISGTYSIDETTGLVNVKGAASSNQNVKFDQLPVQFGRVQGDFSCTFNDLKTLQGAPHYVGLTFDCSQNKLTSLQHAPTEVGESFKCIANDLETLEGAPKEIKGNFNCMHNKLTDLQGAPESVGGYFWCNRNQFKSLQGAPTSVGGKFRITYNPQLPLLRLLSYEHLVIGKPPREVEEVLKKYMGKGKRVMLHCALELKNAGFEGNAKW